MVAKKGELTLIMNSNENTLKHFTFLSTVSSVFFFPLPQEFILSEDYNKMTLVKSYQGKSCANWFVLSLIFVNVLLRSVNGEKFPLQ